jgi:hypothetical protein
MALIDEVKNRIPNEKLVQLTNPDDPDPTTVDDTLLGFAVSDVEADFKVFGGGITYNNSDDRHVSFAVIGVVRKLQLWKLESAADEKHEAWQKSIRDRLRLVTGNNRVVPKSSSDLTPTEEAPDGVTVRPHFDVESTHSDLIPEAREGNVRRSGGLPL